MKKLFFLGLITILSITSKVKAQPNIDTLAVLQTIVANKSSYIGQPFSVLLSQLPISIKYFLPIPYAKRHEEKHTSFAFFYTSDAQQNYRMYPRFGILWQNPLNQSLSYSLWRQTSGAWTSTHSAHYANAIIGDIWIVK
ncbi:MAG: hypothetical protein H7Y86_10345 [Rhizobacter sp.]|nr:hypothetical protein [Ferruginibacter sp.]